MKKGLLLPFLALQLTTYAQQDGIYNDLAMALQEPANVITLDLSGAGLTAVPEELKQFPNLEGLFLQNNQIRVLPASLAANKHLQRIVLDNNPGFDCPVSLKNIAGLELHYLSLRNCNIDFIPVAIAEQAKLSTLILAENHIAQIPEHLGELGSLEEIDLSGNPIRQVSPLIWNCNRLKKLDLSGQKITAIDTVLAICSAMKNLETLKLDYLPSKLYSQLNCKTLILRNAEMDGGFPAEKLNIETLVLQESNILLSDKFFKNISGNANLEALKMENCDLDKGLSGIARCNNLTSIELLSMDPSGTKELQTLKQLKTLRIKNCSVTAQEITDLQAALPNTLVDAEGKPVYPFAAGPVANLQVPVQSYTFNADLPNMITTSNVALTIPARSFTDEKGNPVTGNVQVNYREFFDPVSIALSGINMKMDLLPDGQFMSSGGMFEINASQDGKPLSLAPGSNVTAEVIPVQAGQDFGLFQSDSTEWKTVSRTIAFDSLAPVEAARRRRMANGRPVFNMSKPIYAIQKSIVHTGKGRDFTITVSDWSDYTRLHKKDKNFIPFPEVDVLKKYTFRYNGQCYKEDKKQIDSLSRLITQTSGIQANKFIPANFDYIEMIPDPMQDCFQMVFKFRGINYTYPVIIEEKRKSNTKIQEENKLFYTKWTKTGKNNDRKARIERYNKAEAEYMAAYAVYKKQMDSLGFGNELFFFNPISTADAGLSAIYMAKFKLTAMNKHNIDRIMTNPNSTRMAGNFTIAGETVKPELVILVDVSLNTAFAFSGENEVIFNPRSNCKLIAVIDDYTIGICHREDIQKAELKGNFTLEKIDTRQTKINDIKRML